MADVLSHRVTDWYRSKAEGHGDRRYNLDGRIVLDGEMRFAESDDAFEHELAVTRREQDVDMDEAEAELGRGLSDEARLGLHYARLQVDGYPIPNRSTNHRLTRVGRSFEAARLEIAASR